MTDPSHFFPRVLKLIFWSFSACLCLQCLNCRSSISWEDCEKHTIEEECDEADMVCYTQHRTLQIGQRQHHRFVKSCYYPENCSAKECRATSIKSVNASWCEVQCCDHKDYCNRQSINLASISTVLCLSLFAFVIS